jgi:catechol 2,3-dioxygenase-like lactoylglutathione lyase family enzyme
MIYRYTILYVRDVPATVDLFSRAFGLRPRFIHEGGDYAEMETGGTRLAFSSVALMHRLGKTVAEGPVPAPAFELAFETEDVAAAVLRAVAAGTDLVQGPKVMDWGQTTAYVRTPDGTLVEICSPVPG